MKEYKNNEELVDYLIERNVIITDRQDTLNKIEKYTYYSIVNSYKHIFKNYDGTYKKDVTFNEIYALYNFDKNIKYLFLKYSLEIETQIKSLMSNQISKMYGIQDYLKEDNLDEGIDIEIKNKLIERINNDLEDEYKVHSAIIHYKDKYNFVPPFVLTKILTLGVVSRYYGLLKQSDRQAISKYFKLSDKLLKQILKNLTLIRNICAHNDRLYCFRSKSYLSYKEIDKKYIKEDNETNLYMVMTAMKYFLSNDYETFKNEIWDEINELNAKLTSINISNILNIMGFPMN